jgi:hypothetical protein
MKRTLAMAVVTCSIIGAPFCSRVVALDTVTWGGGNGAWVNSNWVKNGTPGLSASAAMGDTNGGRGGMNITIGGGANVYYDTNNGNTVLGDYDKNSVVDAGDYVVWRKGGPLANDPTPGVQPSDYTYWRAQYGNAALGDFKPRMDLCGGTTCAPNTSSGGSLTIKEGAILNMDSHSDYDGRWFRDGLSMTLDNGTIHRTYSAPSANAGMILLGYARELRKNQHIDINLINGGRIESASKMVFGNADYFHNQGGSNNGHMDGIEVAMTIDGGSLDLTLQSDTQDYFADYGGAASMDLLFFYEYHEAGYNDEGQPDATVLGHPRNEKYSINFTGPGSIKLNPHDIDPDPDFAQIVGGIQVAQQQPSGAIISLGGGPNLYSVMSYQDLWNLGILQANGQSGIQLGSAAFNTYFSVAGTQFSGPYVLNSLIPAGSGSGLHGGTIPEPTSLMLVLMSFAGLGFSRRDRSNWAF